MDAHRPDMHLDLRAIRQRLLEFTRRVVGIGNVAIKPRHVHFLQIPICKISREMTCADVRGNIIVQALAAHADEHRRGNTLDPVPAQDARHATERKLVADFHQVGVFLLENPSQRRGVRQRV
jgi:hypothetical protein